MTKTIDGITVTLAEVRAAAEDYRLIVKVGRSWFGATIRRVHEFGENNWFVTLAAGPNNARGIIQSGENEYGRDFFILPKQGGNQGATNG